MDGGNMRDSNWRSELVEMLAASSAPRVFGTRQFGIFVRQHRPGVSARTSQRVLRDMRAAGALVKLTRGLYVNERASPPVSPWEAAQCLRMGAVISLHSVLGEVGFLNNLTGIAIAVVPAFRGRPRFESVCTQGGARFWFYRLDERFFRTGPPAWHEVYQSNRECPHGSSGSCAIALALFVFNQTHCFASSTSGCRHVRAGRDTAEKTCARLALA